MVQPILFTLSASVVPFQLLRPLPTIFASVQGVCGEEALPEMPVRVREEFDSHLDCLSQMLSALSEMKALPQADHEKLLQMIRGMKEARTGELCEKTGLLNSGLEEVCERQRTAIKEECRAHPTKFRDIYRNAVRVKKLCLICHDEPNERALGLKETLSQRCYYDVDTRSEESIKTESLKSDFAIYAPSQPAGGIDLGDIPKSGTPLLLLIELGKKIEECSIADLRRVFRHQQNNIDALYSPFPPIRLFQKIDIAYVQSLYKTS
ncbi:MAG: hypothetical protein JSV10_04360 [Candidatus Zixiibacteriota bacterium]|nr:MAG: hypothetical protein JSV10_04360 [candidate division Zixibacteria bacterium]